jgi:polyferredoxin|tara:strand:- start:984 stop:1697 length:714 start_codon:yes stop_codon:yes gene_type:complete
MDSKRINWSLFISSFILIIIFAFFIFLNDVYENLSFFWSNIYFLIIYISLFIALVLIVLRYLKKIRLNSRILKIIFGLLFLPAVLFPIFKCYFKVPYIFCKRCPRKCPWGLLRPVLVPSLLVLNLDKRFWCYNMCPLGTLQDYQGTILKKKLCVPKWIMNIRYIFLVLIIFVITKLLFDLHTGEFFFKLTYQFYIWSFSIAVIIFLVSFFIPRFWCNYICPVGSFGDLALKLEKKFK